MKLIIFSGESVRAILDGRKTMTRRVIKFKNPLEGCVWCRGTGHEFVDCGNELSGYDYRSPCQCCWPKCPYQVGNQLWVRETFAVVNNNVLYKADNSATPEKWKPSIFMPQWASRITLEITDVSVERLQEISPKDVIKEGIAPVGNRGVGYSGSTYGMARVLFIQLWQSINGKKHPWSSNPWVWVVSFRRV